jgi:hypothetical protein
LPTRSLSSLKRSNWTLIDRNGSVQVGRLSAKNGRRERQKRIKNQGPMEYILNDKVEGIDYSAYLKYLLTIRADLPEHIYDFASNSNHFDLSAASSLHDAWLESLIVREVASGSRNENRKLEVKLSLLGPHHDRLIHITYSGVERYSFNSPARPGEARYTHTAHGDLLTHEIRLGPHGHFLHEILFERGSTLLVEFSGFSHHEEILGRNSFPHQ